MWNSVMVKRNFNQVLFCIVYTFSNSVSYFVCFTKAVSNNTITITYYNDGSKAKSSTTFYNFSYTIDRNNFFFEFDLASLYTTNIIFQHNS
ncbi:hypothetical protein O71_06637 [Pontibacter sp. BAB1700]|nr:hypothetical protein O71_06637 [Pontibacter sp. BAB1700]